MIHSPLFYTNVDFITFGILDLINLFFRIPKPVFISLAKLIVQLFPLESLGTYYIPAVSGEQAQGKLYSAYQNFKKDLRDAGLVQKRAKLSTTRGK